MEHISAPMEKNAGQPMFEQLASRIKERVESGALRVGDKLPTERELSEQLRLSRGTVRSAYRQLEEDGVIETIRGSGSYVRAATGVTDRRQKDRAARVLDDAIYGLTEMGLSLKEITTLFHACVAAKGMDNVLNLAIIDSNQEAMYDFQSQLSYLAGTALSMFILESVTMSPDPERLLEPFDIIIAPSRHYPRISALIPRLQDKIIKAAISPGQDSLLEIASLDRRARIGILCRTNDFLTMVKDTLLAYGFPAENIQALFEAEYTTSTYFPGGIDALISFRGAHIFTSEAFSFRNEEFLGKGGKLIQFTCAMEQGSLIYLEDRMNTLIRAKLAE